MRTLILLLAALLPLASAEEVTIHTLDGAKTGTLVSLDASKAVLAQGDQRITVTLVSIISMDFGSGKTERRGTRFELVSGDVYRGKLVDNEGMDTLTIDSPSCGRLTLDTQLLARIRYEMPADKAPKVAIERDPDNEMEDVVVLRDGDYSRGIVTPRKRDGGGFSWVLTNDDDEEIASLDDSKVYLIELAPGEPYKAPTDFFAVINCRDGSRFAGRIVGLADRVVEVKAIAGDVTRKVPMASIVSVLFQNGRFVYLTDRQPVEDGIEVVPYFTYKFEPRFDLSRRGTPLRLRGKTYRKGIGMQSRTRITYDVTGFSRFQSTVGIDDLAGDGGSVIFRVYLDGKQVAETKVLRGAGPTAKLDIPLDKAKRMTLEADYADNAHVNDLADWVAPILIK